MLWLIALVAIGWLIHLTGRVSRLESELAATRALNLPREPARRPAPKPQPPAPPPVPARAQPAAPLPLPTPAPPSPQPIAHRVGPSLSTWLSENGLAWIGGGALALGGLFLVAYAVQQGVFTPALRIAAAIAAGFVMLGASEVLRWRSGEAGDYRLSAALAAGAGASTLYASIWAAHQLYGFIGAAPAAALLAAVSLGLLALSFRHGQALALLALGGALLAPATTDAWSPAALSLYLAFIVAAGFAVAGARRWAAAGLVTLAGAGLWALIGLVEGAPGRSGALIVAPVVAALAAAAWRRRADGEPGDLFERLPAVALGLASLVSLLLWPPVTHQPMPALATAAALITLSALAASLRLTPAASHIAPIVALCLGAMLMRLDPRAGAEAAAPWILSLAGLVAAASLAAALRVRDRLPIAAAGALGSLVLTGLAVWILGPSYRLDWLFAAGAALLLGFGAGLLAQRSEAPQADKAVGAWAGSAAAALFLAVHAAAGWRIEPAGQAAAALLLAALFGRLGWRALAGSSLAGALLALGLMLRPVLVGAALDGGLSALAILALGGAVAGLLFAAAFLVERRQSGSQGADALGVAATLAALWAAFLALRAFAGQAPGGLHAFAETGLQTLLLLTAGLLLMGGAQTRPGPIGRWRGEAFLALGVLHGALLQGLILNPWWGLLKGTVVGPLGPETLSLGLLLPALLLVAATIRSLRAAHAWRAWIALAALGFGLLWIVLEIRKLFHGPLLDTGGVGPLEASAYALVGLAILPALDALAALAGRRFGEAPAARRQIARAAGVAGWTALALALAVFGLWASPWWGPSSATLRWSGEAPMLLAGYGLGVAMTLALARAADRHDRRELARAALAVGVVESFVLITLALRFAFHGADMRGGLAEASLETWAYSAAWALFGAAVLSLGAARRSLTLRWAGLVVLALATAKVFLFDTAALEGPMRAASFLALGVLLLGAAVAARRYARGWLTPGKAP